MWLQPWTWATPPAPERFLRELSLEEGASLSPTSGELDAFGTRHRTLIATHIKELRHLRGNLQVLIENTTDTDRRLTFVVMRAMLDQCLENFLILDQAVLDLAHQMRQALGKVFEYIRELRGMLDQEGNLRTIGNTSPVRSASNAAPGGSVNRMS